MKYQLFIYCILALLFSCKKTGNTNYYEINIQDNWTFKKTSDTVWMQADVPGNTLTDLKYNAKLGDLSDINKLNQLKLLLNQDWTYQVNFDVPREILKQDSIYILIEGIAGYAEIYLNGKLSATTSNMFKQFIIPCKGMLQEYNNTLMVNFRNTESLNTIKSIHSKEQNIYTKPRMAPFLSGSEVNPEIPFQGIWKPVKLIAWSKTIIRDIYVETRSVSGNTASLEATLELESVNEGLVNLSININGQVYENEQNILIHKGKNLRKFKITIPNPQLWWCNGMGSQPMYEAYAVLTDAKSIISEKKVTFGIRKIELVEQSDSIGYNFYFKLNNKPVFIKGSTFLNINLFDLSGSEKRSEKIIKDAALANINLLRVWGGGVYEDEQFYELCDRNGILVWQDLPLSAQLIGYNDPDVYSLKDEITENICRIRNHPSLSLIYLNADLNTYSNFKVNPYLHQNEKKDREPSNLFSEEVPHIIHNCGSIPYFSNFSDSLNNQLIREWKVWYDAAPISAYSENHGGFFMEYGMQSFPYKNSVFFGNENDSLHIFPGSASKYQFSDLPWLGAGMNGNQLISDYIQMYYNNPIDYFSFTYLSQLFQSEALKTAIENHRIHKPFTMGTIFWHFNDSWPGITWSVEDYYNRLKPAYYSVKNAFKNIKVIPERIYGDIRVWVVNDSSASFQGECTITLMDFYGRVYFSQKIKTTNIADQPQILWLLNEDNLLKSRPSNTMFLHVSLNDDNHKMMDENFLFFTEPRFLDLPVPDINYTVESYKSSIKIELTSNCFAKNVFLYTNNQDVNFSDNNFDMIPGRKYTVYTDFNGRKSELENNIRIISLIDSY